MGYYGQTVFIDSSLQFEETFFVTVDGANEFILSHAIVVGTELVHLNGLKQNRGLENQYQASNSSIMFNSDVRILSGDVINIIYGGY